MLKAKALENVKGAPVKTHLVQIFWKRWVSLEDLVLELNCHTAANVEQHLRHFFEFYDIPVKSRRLDGRIQYKIGG